MTNRLPERIMNELKKECNNNEYLNPYFLSGILDLLEDYYDIKDDKVSKWCNDMFSM